MRCALRQLTVRDHADLPVFECHGVVSMPALVDRVEPDHRPWKMQPDTFSSPDCEEQTLLNDQAAHGIQRRERTAEDGLT